MRCKTYLNDLGIVTSQGVGHKEILQVLANGIDRDFSRVKVEDKEYEVGRCNFYNSGDNRIDILLKKSCDQIEDSVNYFIKKYGTNRVGVVLGSTDNGSEQSLLALDAYTNSGSFPNGYSLVDQQAHRPAEYVKRHFGLKSIATTISTACTSSGSALILADKMIKSNFLDAVIVGGVDIVSDSVLKGFISLEAVDPNRTNPFSKNRKGINLGEASALFIISKDSYNSSNIGLTGYGEASDAYHSTAPDPEGNGAVIAMGKALKMSGLSSVDYINLHGTGTMLNDNMEAIATKRVFKDIPYLSSTKPIFGHTLGASSALELGICWLLLKNSHAPLPKHIWDEEGDEDMSGLNFVSDDVQINLKCCMSNSYAFGGCNVSLIIEKFDD